MDELPDLPFQLILDNLDFHDLVRCRQLSKKFKFHVEKMKIDQLSISDHQSILIKTSCYSIDERINSENSMKTNLFLDYPKDFKLKDQLRRLFLIGIDCSFGFDLNIINTFTQLEHVELEEVKKKFLYEENIVIKLEKLKIFKIFNCPDFYPYLSLQTPKLEILKTEKLNRLIIYHPETIKYLDIFLFCTETEKFFNLEYLKCADFDGWKRNFLAKFVHLKQIHIADSIRICDFGYSVLKVFINFLFRQKLLLDRKDFQIFMQGVPLTGNELDDFDLKNDNLAFKIKRIDLMDEDYLFDQRKINLNDLMNSMAQHEINDLPEIFFERFSNLQVVKTNEAAINEKNLIWFLNQIKMLNEIEFINSSFNQCFFDSLSDRLSNSNKLICLKIYNNRLIPNFDFIWNFKSLEYFKTNHSFYNSFCMSIESFLLLNRLKYLEFSVSNGHSLAIEREKNQKFLINLFTRSEDMQSIFCKGYMQTSVLTFDQLIDSIEVLKYENHPLAGEMNRRFIEKKICRCSDYYP